MVKTLVVKVAIRVMLVPSTSSRCAYRVRPYDRPVQTNKTEAGKAAKKPGGGVQGRGEREDDNLTSYSCE